MIGSILSDTLLVSPTALPLSVTAMSVSNTNQLNRSKGFASLQPHAQKVLWL